MFARTARERPRLSPENSRCDVQRAAFVARDASWRRLHPTGANNLSVAIEDCTRCSHATCHGSGLDDGRARDRTIRHRDPTPTRLQLRESTMWVGETALVLECDKAVEHVTPNLSTTGTEQPSRASQLLEDPVALGRLSPFFSSPFLVGGCLGSGPDMTPAVVLCGFLVCLRCGG